MSVFRFIGAAYETGDAACWDAAHARAEEPLGAADGALLVARATAVIRVIRIDRPDFGFLPLPCRRLSRDESALMGLIRAASSEAAARRAAREILDSAGGIHLLATAACALASCGSATVVSSESAAIGHRGACTPLEPCRNPALPPHGLGQVSFKTFQTAVS